MFQSLDDRRAYSDKLTDIYESGVRRMTERLVNGEVGLEQWTQDMKDALRQMDTFQAIAGYGGDRSQMDAAWTWVEDELRKQYGFLDGFASDIETAIANGESIDFALSRAELYAGSTRGMFWQTATGDTDLPAYPGDGSSECLGNCGCSWEEGEGGWYWRRGKNDSCATCLQREKEWAPWQP